MEIPMKLLVSQLLATRDTLVAQQTTIGAALSQIDTSLLALGVDVDRLGEPDVAGDCPHPPDQVENLTKTLDDTPDAWICHACGARSSEPFHPED